MFTYSQEDSFSEGVIYPGRALVVLAVMLVLGTILSSL